MSPNTHPSLQKKKTKKKRENISSRDLVGQFFTFVVPPPPCLLSTFCSNSDVVRSYYEPWLKRKKNLKGKKKKAPSWECACSPCSGALCQLYHPLTCRGMSSFKDIISHGRRQGCQPRHKLLHVAVSRPERTSIRPFPHLAPTRFIAMCLQPCWLQQSCGAPSQPSESTTQLRRNTGSRALSKALFCRSAARAGPAE